MLSFRHFVAISAFALMVHPALAANDTEGQAPTSLPAAGQTPGVQSPGDSTAGTNALKCAKPKLTPEQRAERKAQRQQHLAQGTAHRSAKTPEQKAQAAARRAAVCKS